MNVTKTDQQKPEEALGFSFRVKRHEIIISLMCGNLTRDGNVLAGMNGLDAFQFFKLRLHAQAMLRDGDLGLVYTSSTYYTHKSNKTRLL